MHVKSRLALVHVRDNDQNKMRVCVSGCVCVNVRMWLSIAVCVYLCWGWCQWQCFMGEIFGLSVSVPICMSVCVCV